MTLLDRFRTQPQRHPDPAVRLAHLGEIPLTERELIAAIAREDDDPRVRKAAVAKLMDPAALGAISRDDRDESVRAQAASMLRDLALEAFEGVGESDSLEAVDALTDTRSLSQIAKTAGREIVALRALSRLSDAHILGSVARHAESEAVAPRRLRAGARRPGRGDGDCDEQRAQGHCARRARARHRPERARADRRASRRTRAHRSGLATILREAQEREAAEAAARDVETDAWSLLSSTRKLIRLRHPAVEVADAGRDAKKSFAQQRRPRAEAEAEAEARRRQQADAESRLQAAAEEEARRVSERRHARLAELIEVAAAAAADQDLAGARKQMTTVRREWKDLAEGIVVDEALTAQTGRDRSTAHAPGKPKRAKPTRRCGARR